MLREHFSSFFRALWVSIFVFYAALASSIVLYRISPWHPLAEYPGPFFAKISKFYGFYMMSTGKNHILHKKLHEKYGPYVRIGEWYMLRKGCETDWYWIDVGPNEISMIDVSAISAVLGADGMPKGPSEYGGLFR